jgi:hypothetical protein
MKRPLLDNLFTRISTNNYSKQFVLMWIFFAAIIEISFYAAVPSMPPHLNLLFFSFAVVGGALITRGLQNHPKTFVRTWLFLAIIIGGGIYINTPIMSKTLIFSFAVTGATMFTILLEIS